MPRTVVKNIRGNDGVVVVSTVEIVDDVLVGKGYTPLWHTQREGREGAKGGEGKGTRRGERGRRCGSKRTSPTII